MLRDEAIHILQMMQREWRLPEHKVDALEMAIKSLEKQFPKIPIKSGVTDDKGIFHPINGINGVPYDLCPSCKTNLCTDGFLGRSKKSMKYCENCGQKLDWSEEE